MRLNEVTRKNLNPKDWIKKAVDPSVCRETIDYDCEVVDQNGQHLISYLHHVDDMRLEDVRKALVRVKYITDIRTGGLATNSRIFGYAPRNPIRNHICRKVTMAIEQPIEHHILTAASDIIESLYKKYSPEAYEHHRSKAIEKISDDWRIGDTVFTSGIANKNNALAYHYDSGNVKHCRSAMFAFKKNVKGGELCMPELDIKFDLGDRSLILFDGQSIIHGVAPLKVGLTGGYRITSVFYTLEEMWKCLPINEEVMRERERRSRVESKQAKEKA